MNTHTKELLSKCNFNIKILNLSNKNIEGMLDLNEFKNLENFCENIKFL